MHMTECHPLFELSHIDVQYTLHGTPFLALKNISLQGSVGETLGIVGESGCGKSTLAKTLLHMLQPIRGNVFFKGKKLGALSYKEIKHIRKEIQPVFQDPDAALNPRMTVKEQLTEGLIAHAMLHSHAAKEHIAMLLEMVQLSPSLLDRFPFQLSGGQKQRICIARALSIEPELVVCDEPLSSLDFSIRLQIIELFKRIQKTKNLAYLFITHDLSTLQYIAHRIAVLYLGSLVEIGTAEEIYKRPLHPYTQALLSAIPIPDPQKEKKRNHIVLPGDIPSPLTPPRGCPFHTRCPHAMPLCKEVNPLLTQKFPGHAVACHLYP